MMRSDMTLSIGALARQGRVSVEAVRYYERLGLIDPAPRAVNRYRRYPPAALERLRFIKRGQAAGFTLKDIKELLPFLADSGTSCAGVRARAAVKSRQIDARIAALRRMKSLLDAWTAECSSTRPADPCPILEGLKSGKRAHHAERRARL
jgi:DNA-binding transcriptional MerR regulator